MTRCYALHWSSNAGLVVGNDEGKRARQLGGSEGMCGNGRVQGAVRVRRAAPAENWPFQGQTSRACASTGALRASTTASAPVRSHCVTRLAVCDSALAAELKILLRVATTGWILLAATLSGLKRDCSARISARTVSETKAYRRSITVY